MAEQLQLARARLSAETNASTCRLCLVRHGTTTADVENRYRGRRDIPLDGQGYRDAVEAARELSHAGLAAVYTGPLRRAIATAQIIADESDVPDLRILQGLNNVDYGLWEGMTAKEAAMYHPEAYELYRTSPSRAVCPAGERLRDAQARIIGAMRLIGSRHGGEVVVAVTHAVMIRLVVAELKGIEDESWRIRIGRGLLTQFIIENGAIRLAGPPESDDATDRSIPHGCRIPGGQVRR
jgi:broad specificity phosphatase PhoE